MTLRRLTNRLSLASQVGLATAGLCLVLVAILAAGASYVGREHVRKFVGAQMAEHARIIADRLDRSMAARFADAIMLTELDPLKPVWSGDANAIRNVLEQLQTKLGFARWIGFATPDGQVRAATGRVMEGESVESASWFRHGQDGIVAGRVEESRLSLEPADGQPGRPVYSLDIAAPVRAQDGHLAGVLGIDLDWAWAEALMRSAQADSAPGGQTELMVFSWDGHRVGGETSKPALSLESLRDIYARHSGAYLDMQNGVVMLNGFARTDGFGEYPGLGWIVIAQQPAAAAYALANDVVKTILIWGLGIAIFGVTAAILISRRVSRPMQALAAATDRLGRDPTAMMLPYLEGSREITRLSRALRSLVRRIDITQREKAEVETASEARALKLSQDINTLHELAQTDPLTGLPNRRGMQTYSDDLMSRVAREGETFGVFVIDIDHFKRVNDTFGHAAGDAVICHVAGICRDALRPSDRVARFGGEEFVAVFRNVPLILAGELAERIRIAVEAGATRFEDVEIPVTVSIGVAMARPGDRDMAEIVERADRALYDAKTSGRNRVAIMGAEVEDRVQAA